MNPGGCGWAEDLSKRQGTDASGWASCHLRDWLRVWLMSDARYRQPQPRNQPYKIPGSLRRSLQIVSPSISIRFHRYHPCCATSFNLALLAGLGLNSRFVLSSAKSVRLKSHASSGLPFRHLDGAKHQRNIADSRIVSFSVQRKDPVSVGTVVFPSFHTNFDIYATVRFCHHSLTRHLSAHGANGAVFPFSASGATQTIPLSNRANPDSLVRRLVTHSVY